MTRPIVPEDRSYSTGLAHCRAEMALLALEIRRDLEALRAEVAQLKAELAAESSERD